jgi:N-acetylglucosamine-6-sulfatase
MQGESIKEILKGEDPGTWRDAVYYRYWMHLAHHHIPAHYGLRDNRYKLVFFYGLPLDASLGNGDYPPSTPGWELYDLQEDPQETRNVYDDPAYANVVARLKTRLADLKVQYEDQDDLYPELLKVRKETP